MRLRPILVALALLAPSLAWAGNSMYVRAAGTELKASAGPGAATVTKLDIGLKVEVLETRGPWAKVKATVQKQEQQGFVFLAKLSKDKPDKERFGGGGSVASASENDTAQALRGLTPTAEKFAGRTKISNEDIAAVKQMEDRKISKDEVTGFLKDGKLAEYGENVQ